MSAIVLVHPTRHKGQTATSSGRGRNVLVHAFGLATRSVAGCASRRVALYNPVFVSLRLVSPVSGTILAATDYALPMDANLRDLLGN